MKAKTMESPKWLRILNMVLITLLCVSIVLPFLHVLAIAFNEGTDTMRGGIALWPRKWTLENFVEVFKQDNLLNGLAISVFRTVVGTLAGMFLMSMAAYALTVSTTPGMRVITFFIFFTMLFGGGTVPYYLVLNKLKLTGSIWVYIIPSLFSVSNIFLLRTAFQGLPYSVIEQARLDGCNEFEIYWKIVLPMSKPTLATVALFTAVGHWNDWYSGSFYVRDANLKPLATLLQDMLTRQDALADILMRSQGAGAYAELDKVNVTGQSLQMATIIVTVLPILIAYPMLQKHFVSGITVGSIKE